MSFYCVVTHYHMTLFECPRLQKENIKKCKQISDINISNFGSISKGDEVQKIILKQAGRFDFAITGLNDSTFIILKERVRVDGEIYYDTIYAQPIGATFSKTIDLVEGNILYGFY